MFEELFKKPSALARHTNAPYAAERVRYLAHCAQQSYTHATLLLIARELLWVARKLSVYPDLYVTHKQIKAAAAQGWADRQRYCGRALNKRWTSTRFIQVARQWLRFLGCLIEPVEYTPSAEVVEDFASWMEHERGLSPRTIQLRCRYIKQFLRWYGAKGRLFSEIHVRDVDAFLTICGAKDWSRAALKNVADALRAFFRYVCSNGGCSPTIADVIQGPRIFAQEGLVSAPSWQDVRRLLTSTETTRPEDIRDRAILMLFAIYGLRASEVSKLRLEDIDWEHDLIVLRRTKQGRTQIYPLLPVVGNAIVEYLQTIRPQCSQREVFLTLIPPFRPLSRSALYGLTSKRMLALGIDTSHRGPHSLRHACAAHLVSGEFSLKEIGDHLGHRSTSATRIYAKVDLPKLREVAAFDLGGLI